MMPLPPHRGRLDPCRLLLPLLAASLLFCTRFVQASLSEGCTYKVQAGDTLHKISKTLNIQMDEVQAKNSVDLTDPTNMKPGSFVDIPCPGSRYQQYLPLGIAGCFFDFIIDSSHPTILSIVKNPPDDIPGPFSITGIWAANYQAPIPYSTAQGIWTANYQALLQYSIDLTAPGQFYTGRRIYLPTCGHSGELIDTTPVSNTHESCFLDCSHISSKGTKPSTIAEVAAALNVSVASLTKLQKGKVPPVLGPGSVLSIPCNG